MNIRPGVSAVIVQGGELLLVEFMDERARLRYNLPGGGVHDNKPLQDAVLPYLPLIPKITLSIIEALPMPSHIPYVLNEAL